MALFSHAMRPLNSLSRISCVGEFNIFLMQVCININSLIGVRGLIHSKPLFGQHLTFVCCYDSVRLSFS